MWIKPYHLGSALPPKSLMHLQILPLHYLNVFFCCWVCLTHSRDKIFALHTFARLGIPVTTHKIEGPETVLVFLRILINSWNFELRLPTDKLHKFHEAMSQWMWWSAYKRQELDWLLGHLFHTATAITRQLFSPLSLSGQSAIPLHPAQLWGQSWPILVKHIPPRLEWQFILPSHVHLHWYILRSLWNIWLWGISTPPWMVPMAVAVARWMALNPYHSERAIPCCDCF